MKSTLEFTLPEESHECALAHAANQLASVIWDVDQWARGLLRHGDPETYFATKAEAVEAVRDKLREFAAERGVAWELIES